MICASLALLQIMFAVHRFTQGATAALPLRVVVAADAADYKKAGPRPRHFDRSGAEWRNLPPSDGTGGITAGDLSAQSIIKAFSICPIPTCISARDDDVGERPSRHFDGRSGVEKSPSSYGTGSITREISRLRVSWERLPSVSHTDTQPRSR